ncbi:MAG: co-chaperone DjlA [Francisella sp.]|nr:MAG: co-chaperone DjlA [Francisella sp.]
MSKQSISYWPHIRKFLLILLLAKIILANFFAALWLACITYLLKLQMEQRLQVHYIRSQFFPGELTLLEYNILVTFYVLGCVAKAKGRVASEDIDYAVSLMKEFNIPSASVSRLVLIHGFNKGKVNAYHLRRVLGEFSSFFKDQHYLRSYFFDYQLECALKEGKLLPQEKDLLAFIAREIGISTYTFNKKIESAQAAYRFRQRFQSRHGRGDQFKHQKDNNETYQDWYQNGRDLTTESLNSFHILGVSKYADFATVKKAYRALINEYHPDKFVFKDVPEAVMYKAKEKSQEIIKAYDVVCRARGWK